MSRHVIAVTATTDWPWQDAVLMSVSEFFASILRRFRSDLRADHEGLKRVQELLETTKPTQDEKSHKGEEGRGQGEAHSNQV